MHGVTITLYSNVLNKFLKTLLPGMRGATITLYSNVLNK